MREPAPIARGSQSRPRTDATSSNLCGAGNTAVSSGAGHATRPLARGRGRAPGIRLALAPLLLATCAAIWLGCPALSPTNEQPSGGSGNTDTNGGNDNNGNAGGATDNTGGNDGSNTAPGVASDALAKLQVFPPDNPWNQDVSALPVHPNSAALLASIGLDTGLHPDFGTVWEGAPIGIPFVLVPGTQPKVSVSFDYADESDPGPYPIPPDPPIEGGADSDGDRHVLVIDVDHQRLYELYDAHLAGSGWTAGSGAIFDLTSNALRPAGWTSADAAGLPIFPGLVRYDEAVERGAINHALRFTVQRTRRAYIAPARHYASDDTDANLPPMGLRVRLRADFDVTPFPASVRPILRAMQKYGMIVADNGSDWYVSGAPDSRWDDDALHSLGEVKGRDFEVVYTGDAVTD